MKRPADDNADRALKEAEPTRKGGYPEIFVLCNGAECVGELELGNVALRNDYSLSRSGVCNIGQKKSYYGDDGMDYTVGGYGVKTARES